MQKSKIKVKEIDFVNKKIVVEEIGEIEFSPEVKIKGLLPYSFTNTKSVENLSLRALRGILKDTTNDAPEAMIKELRLENERKI